MIRVLFAAGDSRWSLWKEPLRTAFDERGLDVDLAQHHAPDEVDIIVYAPGGALRDFGPYVNTRAVLSIWAGVEAIVGNQTLTQPLARMVDPGLTEGMVEYVCGHVLRHHLGIDAQIAGQDGVWKPAVPPLARDRPVTVLGLGALGVACGTALAQLGFPVTGWSRTEKSVEGIRCLSGPDALPQALAAGQIVVCLLPLTDQTENILNCATLGYLPAGAVIINPGRGGLIVEPDLMAALETGQVGHATLDTFRVEPLPQDHPFWSHPGVTVTPHIASETRPETAARVIAENTERAMTDQPLLHLVDRARGY